MTSAAAVHTLDLRFQGLPEAIAAFAVVGPEGACLIECGPMSCLPRLMEALSERGIDPGHVRDVLLTHIHLDHAGSAGWWAARGARVHVHPAGARHLADPSRLLASARMVYGDALEALWGDVPAVPPEQIRKLGDGEAVGVAGLDLLAWHTPGHARHHVAFGLGGQLFTGDVGGIRLPAQHLTFAPTPPPDLDLPAWRASLDRMTALQPEGLYLTHFGRVDDPATHLASVGRALDADEAWLDEAAGAGAGRDALVTSFEQRQRADLAREGVTGATVAAYLASNPAGMAVDGLLRHRAITGPGTRTDPPPIR